MGSVLSSETNANTENKKVDSEDTASQQKNFEDLAKMKNKYYQVPESPFDNFPILSEAETEKILSQLPKISLSALYSESEFESAAKTLSQQLQEEGFAVIELSPQVNVNENQNEGDNSSEFRKMSQNILQVAEQFFSLPTQEKKTIAKPGEEDGKRNAFSGYSEIHFLNNDNLRDEERRDVFQVRLGEEYIPWPNSEFQKAVVDFYHFQWKLSLRILLAISQSLNIRISSLLNLVSQLNQTHNQTHNQTQTTETEKKSKDLDLDLDLSELIDRPETSQNTNLCLFRYHDVVGYKQEQRCMVHVDNGLVTILSNWTTKGALQVLSAKHQHFLPIDAVLDPNNHMIVYCGHSMHFVTNGVIQGQIHRVVRQPQAIRYSFPFELKPFDEAVLRRFIQPNNTEPTTAENNVGSSDASSSSSTTTTTTTTQRQGFRTELCVTDSATEYVFANLMKQISWQRVRQKVARADNYGSDTPWYLDFYSTDMN